MLLSSQKGSVHADSREQAAALRERPRVLVWWDMVIDDAMIFGESESPRPP
jgi:hypothetical protein